MGHRVVLAGNGMEAVQAHASGPFDLGLIELQMPEMDGLTAISAIHAAEAPAQSHTPIIAITAHASPDGRERCLDAGMDDFLSKPIDLHVLANLIERVARAR